MTTKPLWALADDQALADLIGGFRETERSSRYGPYGYLGKSRLNLRTYQAMTVAYWLVGQPRVITQGGLNNGAVHQSAATHDGLDVGDGSIRFPDGKVWPESLQFEFVAALDECGACGMLRGSGRDGINDGMVPHCHTVMYGAQHAHPQARASLYDRNYGTLRGGAGLAGLPRARWYGPPLRHTGREWVDSPYNPANGWRP